MQTSETEEMAEDAAVDSLPLEPPPQPVTITDSKSIARADRNRLFKQFTSDSNADRSYYRNLLFQRGVLELYAFERFGDIKSTTPKTPNRHHATTRQECGGRFHWGESLPPSQPIMIDTLDVES